MNLILKLANADFSEVINMNTSVCAACELSYQGHYNATATDMHVEITTCQNGGGCPSCTCPENLPVISSSTYKFDSSCNQLTVTSENESIVFTKA